MQNFPYVCRAQCGRHGRRARRVSVIDRPVDGVGELTDDSKFFFMYYDLHDIGWKSWQINVIYDILHRGVPPTTG